MNTAPYWMQTPHNCFLSSLFLESQQQNVQLLGLICDMQPCLQAKVHVHSQSSAPAGCAHVHAVFPLSSRARMRRSRHLLWLCMWCVYSLKLASSPRPIFTGHVKDDQVIKHVCQFMGCTYLSVCGPECVWNNLRPMALLNHPSEYA